MRRSNATLFPRLPPPPAGHVWVEWVGEASPLDHPEVQMGLVTGAYTRDQQRVIRRLCQTRMARVHGHMRSLRKGGGPGELPGLTQPLWRWGADQRAAPGTPGSYCQALPFRDADVVKGSSVGHEFIVHHERDGEALDLIVQRETPEVKLVGQGMFADFGGFRRVMGW